MSISKKQKSKSLVKTPIKFSTFFIAVFAFMLFQTSLFSQEADQNNWKQFRNSDGSGIATGTELLETWPETGLQQLWKTGTGSGFPEVAVRNGRAYIFSGDTLDGGSEYLAALEANTGKQIWKTKVDSLYLEVDGWGHGPRSTPLVDKEIIYCLSGNGRFTALDTKKGNILWARSLPEEFGTQRPRWGFSSSPLLADELLILETGAPENKAYTAFDKITGKVLWSTGDGKASYNSPLVAIIENQKHIVATADTMLYAFDTQGNTLWSFRMPLRSPTAIPVFIPPNKFFVSSVSNTGSFIVEINNNQASEILKSPTMQNNWSSSCYYDGYLYGFSKAKLQCVSVETGIMKWGKRGFGKGSLIIVNDKLLVLSDRGKLVQIKATPEAYTQLGMFQALEGKSWTAPSFAAGKIFVRNLTSVACYKLSK